MKKRTTLFTSVFFALYFALSLGAMSLEATESAVSMSSQNQSNAVLAATVTPGINLVTGTKDAETFEAWEVKSNLKTTNSWTNTNFRFGGDIGDVDIVDTSYTRLSGVTPAKGKSVNARVWTDALHYSTVHIENSADTLGRKYHVAFDVYSTAVSEGSTKNFLRVMDGYDIVVKDVTSDSGVNTGNKEWKHIVADGMFSDPNGVKLQFQTSAGNNGAKTVCLFIDDLIVMPYYKVTYKIDAGDIIDWVLFEQDGETLATTYTFAPPVSPDAPFGYKFAGWSLNPDATVADLPTSVALENKDIFVYPVWVKDEAVPDAVVLTWDYEDGTAQGWTATGYTANVKNGILKVDTANAGYLMHEAKTLDTSVYHYLVFNARSVGTASNITFRFKTTQNDYSDDTTVSIPINAGDKKFGKYYVDLSANSLWKGDYIEGKFSFGTGNGTVEIEDVTFCNIFDPSGSTGNPTDVEKFSFDISDTNITTEGGTVTIYPYARLADGTEIVTADTLLYATDTVNAALTKNADGSATVTGKMNGQITVDVYILGTDLTDTFTIDISGQTPKIAVNNYKVLNLGNSILWHGKDESIGWSWSGYGMAASSIDKDYVHRFQYYLGNKYGAANVEFSTYQLANFERLLKNDSTTYSYETEIAEMVATAKEYQPDIITIQMGENASHMTSAGAYENATTRLVEGLKKVAPNAEIVVCTPFWGGSGRIDGMQATANKFNIPLVDLHSLSLDNENMAYGQFSAELDAKMTDGVRRHPGDKGMDNIAKRMFDAVNKRLSQNEKTVYTAVFPTDLVFTSTETQITADRGTLQLEAQVIPADAAKDIVWSTSNKDIARVDENGLVTAVNNGSVTITAASRYSEDVTASVVLTVSGQTLPKTVTYNKNTTDEVTGMPAPNQLAKYTFPLNDVFPYRENYAFLGWSLTPDGDPVSYVEITEDITVYAKWERAYKWNFNTDGYKQDITVINGFNQYVLNGKFMSIATETNLETGEVLRIVSPKLNLPADAYDNLVITMQNTDFNDSTKIDLTIHTSNGDVKFTAPVTTKDYATYTFGLNEVIGTITGFEFTPTNIDCTINLDFIGFVADPIAALEDKVSLRVAEPVGIRFRAMIASAVLVATVENDSFAVDEFGCIVSSAYRIEDPSLLDLTAVANGLALKGVAYSKADGVRIFYEETEQNIIFTAVLTNIPQSKAAYETLLYVRTYTILENGAVIYGDVISDTVAGIAEKLENSLTGSESQVYNDFINKVNTTLGR